MSGPLALAPYGWLDHYDHMMDRRAPGVPVWQRNTRDDFPTRREQLRVMGEAFHRRIEEGRPVGDVPRWGVGARELNVELWACPVRDHDKVVVYFDETMHQGEGKRLDLKCNVGPDECWADFIEPPPTGGESVRWLKVGRFEFALRYRSSGDWRSNVRTDYIEVEELSLPAGACDLCDELMRRYRSPLLAIDFAVSSDGSKWATDLNLAPGLRGSGVEDYLSGRACAEEIKRFWYEVCRG